jgi:c-di-GMP-binding flagellar brake protein YcgR
MRLTLTPDLPRFELNQKVKIQFKIYKRAQVAVLGTVRHLRKNKSGGPTLGIEFNEMSELVKGKIQNICDDIGYHQAHHALDL